MNNLQLYSQVNASKLKKQTFVVEKMVKNKLKLAESDLFDPKQLKTDLTSLKHTEHTLKMYDIKAEFTNYVQFFKTKNEYDQQINELKVQGTTLKSAADLIVKSYDNYINIFKKNNDKGADKWFE